MLIRIFLLFNTSFRTVLVIIGFHKISGIPYLLTSKYVKRKVRVIHDHAHLFQQNLAPQIGVRVIYEDNTNAFFPKFALLKPGCASYTRARGSRVNTVL